MEGGIALIILLIVGVPIFLAIWLVVRAAQAGSKLETLFRRIEALEVELQRLKERPPAAPTRAPETQPLKPEPASTLEYILQQRELKRPKPPEPPITPPAQPPPLPPQPAPVFQPPPRPEPVLAQSTPPQAESPPVAEPVTFAPSPQTMRPLRTPEP